MLEIVTGGNLVWALAGVVVGFIGGFYLCYFCYLFGGERKDEQERLIVALRADAVDRAERIYRAERFDRVADKLEGKGGQ